MHLPTFDRHPDEKRDFELAIIAGLQGAGFIVHVIDRRFDLLVESSHCRCVSYIELKVRLNRGHSCPISPAQWQFLHGAALRRIGERYFMTTTRVPTR